MEGGWDTVATEEALATQDLAECADEGQHNTGSEDECGSSSLDEPDAFERVSRFQAARSSVRDDPYWLEPFFTIIENLAGVYSPDDTTSKLQTPINLLSGCSGLCAEGWVCQAGSSVLSLVLNGLPCGT